MGSNRASDDERARLRPTEEGFGVPACPVCADQRSTLVFTVTDLNHGYPGAWPLVRCESCELAYLADRPVDDAATYPADYSQHVVPEPSGPGRTRLARFVRAAVLAAGGYRTPSPRATREAPAAVKTVASAVPFLRARAQWLLPLFPPGPPKGRLLDFGCGNGAFLKIMEDLGWDVVGIERDDTSAAIARSRGLAVYSVLNDAAIEPGSLAVVTLNHVIEHLRHPVDVLSGLHPLLGPDGLVGLATPNWNSAARHVFGRSWYAIDAPRHLMLHTRRSMTTLLRAAGFTPFDVRTTSAREWWLPWPRSFALAKGRPGSPLLRLAALPTALVAGAVGGGEELVVWARPEPRRSAR